MKVNL
jgi:hypothetical protein